MLWQSNKNRLHMYSHRLHNCQILKLFDSHLSQCIRSIWLRLHSNLNVFGEETTLDLFVATISSPLWKPPSFTWHSVSATDFTASNDACNHDLSCGWNKTIRIAFFSSVSFPASVLFFYSFLHLTGDSSVTTPWIVTHSCGADTAVTSIFSALHFLVAIAKYDCMQHWKQQFLCC